VDDFSSAPGLFVSSHARASLSRNRRRPPILKHGTLPASAQSTIVAAEEPSSSAISRAVTSRSVRIRPALGARENARPSNRPQSCPPRGARSQNPPTFLAGARPGGWPDDPDYRTNAQNRRVHAVFLSGWGCRTYAGQLRPGRAGKPRPQAVVTRSRACSRAHFCRSRWRHSRRRGRGGSGRRRPSGRRRDGRSAPSRLRVLAQRSEAPGRPRRSPS
jgi:hypothetical protein